MIRILEAQVRVDEDVRREKEQRYVQRNVGGDNKPRHDTFWDRDHGSRGHPYSSRGRGLEQHYKQPRKEVLNI